MGFRQMYQEPRAAARRAASSADLLLDTGLAVVEKPKSEYSSGNRFLSALPARIASIGKGNCKTQEQLGSVIVTRYNFPGSWGMDLIASFLKIAIIRSSQSSRQLNQALSLEKTDRKKAESIAHDQLVHKCKKVQSIVPARLSEE